MADVTAMLGAPMLGGSISALLGYVLKAVPTASRRINFYMALSGFTWWVCIYALMFLLTARPVFSTCLVVGFHLLLLAVNHTKYKSLKEPFILQDFEYFTDAILHPRLYIPFFGILKTVAILALVVMGIGCFIWLEPALYASGSVYWASMLGGSVVSAFMLVLVSRKVAPVPSYTPEQDVTEFGLFGALTAYWLRYRYAPDLVSESLQALSDSMGKVDTLPHRVMVQSESFFDPRERYACVPASCLQHWDALSEQALQTGKLAVPAWGANTVRTEASILTGIEPAKLGVRQFNPYHYFAAHPVQSLASMLRAQGYKTVCIHPYPASFYKRDKVMPNLGFDEFIDIRAFKTASKCGQYIGDKELIEKIRIILEDADGPVFVFVITMENHGPLSLEKPLEKHLNALGVEPGNDQLNDLAVYLRHLENADAMLRGLADLLLDQSRDGEICWYGDHVPIMPQVYEALGEPAAETPYLFWSTRRSAEAAINVRSQALNAQELAACWLQRT